MPKSTFIKRFREDEDGAISVDWVVLTAALVGLAAGTIATVQDSTGVLTGKIESGMTNTDVNGSE
ncbi:hypothetical protein D6850_02015 [Roseovarius spongiae]|uniref:Pilus assembly protein n=1 Tax=Roseovarius spongiae TaxID=2320272 RepID=A0A3A8AX35_9RHOB|nr:hypothetical protein [Roseovarius spongiae]RKF16357.1 hypothetical protein D6850_02015 [Roseovarius spongiae]